MKAGRAGRWFKFQTVGAFGVLVHMASLKFLHESIGWSVSAATAAAVEVAILHNFVWHVRWTWGNTNRPFDAAKLWRQLWQYNLLYCLISMATNLGFTNLYMNAFHLHYLVANLLAIATGGIANFAAGEFLVFRKKECALHAASAQKLSRNPN